MMKFPNFSYFVDENHRDQASWCADEAPGVSRCYPGPGGQEQAIDYARNCRFGGTSGEIHVYDDTGQNVAGIYLRSAASWARRCHVQAPATFTLTVVAKDFSLLATNGRNANFVRLSASFS